MNRFIMGILVAAAVLVVEEEGQYWNAVLGEHEKKPIGAGVEEKLAIKFLSDVEDRAAWSPDLSWENGS